MTIQLPTVSALAVELEKIAEHHQVMSALDSKLTSFDELQKKLQPGDIIFTAPDRKRIPAWARHIYKPISKLVQGTDYGHTAIYVGDGNVVDARMGRTAVQSSLKQMLNHNNVVAFRPKVSPAEKKQAIEYASSQVGTPFSLRSLIRAATPIRGKRRGNKPEMDNKLICSALVANAYSKRKFSPAARLYTRPSEIMNSALLKPIASVERFNKKRSA